MAEEDEYTCDDNGGDELAEPKEMESEWGVVGWLLGEPVSGHFDVLSKQTCCDAKSRNGRKIFAPLKDEGRIKAKTGTYL